MASTTLKKVVQIAKCSNENRYLGVGGRGVHLYDPEFGKGFLVKTNSGDISVNNLKPQLKNRPRV